MSEPAKKPIFILLLMLFALNVSSQQNDPGKQALEQLRMLQQQLLNTDQTSQAHQITNDHQNETTLAEQSRVPPVSRPPPSEIREKNHQVVTKNRIENPEEVIDDLAFKRTEKQLFPLSPNEITQLKQRYQTNQFAQESPVGTPPKPTATSQFVNLSPGSTPPVIRLSQGFVTSLVFLDSTGAPWPISAYDLGDPSAFNIQWDRTSNTLMIQSSKLYTYGNLAVRLAKLNTPVMITLIPGQKAVDYRVDLRIQGYGPNAKNMPLEEGLPPSASDVLLNVLDGVPPLGARRLTVTGGDARAWLLDDRLFVRTNLTILSPGWIGSMTSGDGMHAYELQKTPILLVSWHGKVMQLKVEGL